MGRGGGNREIRVTHEVDNNNDNNNNNNNNNDFMHIV
jgi:hypothetical protein